MQYCFYERLPFIADPFSFWRACLNETGLFFLDSAREEAPPPRYSFLGFNPRQVFSGNTLKDWSAFVAGARQQKSAGPIPPFPFWGGYVGYMSYDFGRLMESLPIKEQLAGGPDKFVFGMYDQIVVFDHALAKSYAIVCATRDEGPCRLKQYIKALEQIWSRHKHQEPVTGHSKIHAEIQSDFDSSRYQSLIKQAQRLIAAGEIYEINLSRRFHLKMSAPLTKYEGAAIYQSFREKTRAPFAGYFDAGSFRLMSSSPELFLEVKEGHIQTRPMKGTRPRSADPFLDARLRLELENSIKEKAELLMVTDLLRNDLGKVCVPGSVTVTALREIEAFRNVFQSSSVVEGDLAKGRDIFDLIEAAFPGGSVTGCPKRRAMEIIDALESSPRGFYTGGFGYMGFNGNMMWNMLIRSLFIDDQEISFSTGGGIVSDSDPEQEFIETEVKAASIRETLAGV